MRSWLLEVSVSYIKHFGENECSVFRLLFIISQCSKQCFCFQEEIEGIKETRKPTNNDVVQIVNSLKQENNFGVQQFSVSFTNIFPQLLVTTKSKSLYNKADRVHKKATNLRRNQKISQLEVYLESEFEVPKEESNANEQRALEAASTEKEKKLTRELADEKQKSKGMKRQISDLRKLNKTIETTFLELETHYFDILKKMEKMNDEMGKILTENQESESNLIGVMEEHKQLCFKYEQHQAEIDMIQKKLSNCDKTYTKIKF